MANRFGASSLAAVLAITGLLGLGVVGFRAFNGSACNNVLGPTADTCPLMGDDCSMTEVAHKGCCPSEARTDCGEEADLKACGDKTECAEKKACGEEADAVKSCAEKKACGEEADAVKSCTEKKACGEEADAVKSCAEKKACGEEADAVKSCAEKKACGEEADAVKTCKNLTDGCNGDGKNGCCGACLETKGEEADAPKTCCKQKN
jgi:hypothetical protein